MRLKRNIKKINAELNSIIEELSTCQKDLEWALNKYNVPYRATTYTPWRMERIRDKLNKIKENM